MSHDWSELLFLLFTAIEERSHRDNCSGISAIFRARVLSIFDNETLQFRYRLFFGNFFNTVSIKVTRSCATLAGITSFNFVKLKELDL